MKILVTDGNTRAALAITRSLGQKGHQVFVGETDQPSLASSSRYCSSCFVYPNPFHDADVFIDNIIETIRKNSIEVILPVTDITTMLMTDNRDLIEQYSILPFPLPGSIKIAADKYQIMKLADKLNIPIPKTWYLKKHKEIDDLPDTLPYPIVIKPHMSRIRVNDKQWISANVSYADDKKKLATKLKGEDKELFPILIQERINGPGVGVFVCCHRGKLVALFSHRRLREKPPSGGVSVLRESIAVPPMAKRFSEILMECLDWNGVAMIEFKVDERDNIPKLMEINGRFWGSLQLAIDAGVDFPSILIDTIKKDEITPVFSYKLGVKTRWFWGDVDTLLMILLKRLKELNLPVGHSGRIKYLIDFLKMWEKDLHYEVFRKEDIRPWIYETKEWFKRSINGRDKVY